MNDTSKNVSETNNYTSKNKNPSFNSKTFNWDKDRIDEINEKFNSNAHQTVRQQSNYSKKNTYYYNFNKCGVVKKSYRCHYYGCLPCQFIYMNTNYKILKELKTKIKPQMIGNELLYPTYMVTYRIPILNDDLNVNYNLLNKCIKDFKYKRLLEEYPTKYEEFLEEIGYIASVISFECPFSYAINAHILHNHEYIIAEKAITKKRSLEIETILNAQYQGALNKNYAEYGLYDFMTIENFVKNKKLYSKEKYKNGDDQSHHTAIFLLNDFQSPEYLSNPYKLYRGFEKELDEFEHETIHLNKELTYSPYLNAMYNKSHNNRSHYLNFLNNLPINVTVADRGFNFNSAWLKYGEIEGIDLREYFKLGEFKDLSSAQIQDMKESQKAKNHIADTKKNIRNRYKNKDDETKSIIISNNLFNYFSYRNDYNVDELNLHLKKLKKSKADRDYLKEWQGKLIEFQIGYRDGYFSIKKNNRELINHDHETLPLDETNEEIRNRADKLCDKYLQENSKI